MSLPHVVEDSTDLTLEQSNKFMANFFATEPTMADMVEIGKYMMSEEYKDRVTLPPVHIFSEGMYSRELTIPAGVLVVGKRHAKSHLTFLISGTATIVNDEGIETLTGPVGWADEPGVKRAVYAHSDATFLTVHRTSAATVEEAERDLMVPELGAVL